MPESIVKPVRRHERSDARRLALQLLYQSEMLGQSAGVIVQEQRYIAEEGVLSPYALGLLTGVEKNQEVIDEYLKVSSENWTLTRMPAVDRSLLRLAVYEMLYVKDVPLSVSINEAVELAKDFGGEDESPRFVNGILGRIAKSIEAVDPARATVPGNTSEVPELPPEDVAPEKAVEYAPPIDASMAAPVVLPETPVPSLSAQAPELDKEY
ncbi:MAG: transcription antitermination factor NusB [Raoultibacter sp.]